MRKTMRKIITKQIVYSVSILTFCILAIIAMAQNEFLSLDYSKPIKLDPSNTIVIDGTIGSPATARYFRGKVANMLQKREQLVQLVQKGATTVNLVINSPGGELKSGNFFVNTMHSAQKLGVQIRCIVDGKAYSMALIIFSSCDERLATFGSRLMWHSMSTSWNNRINQKNAVELADYILTHNEKIWSSTRIHFWPSFFVEHFNKETFHDATTLERYGFRYLRVIRGYTGLQAIEKTAKPKVRIKIQIIKPKGK